MAEELDAVDKKRVVQKKFDCIGVKARVDSNRPKNKEELEKERQKVNLEAQLRKLTKRKTTKKEKQERIFNMMVNHHAALHNAYHGNQNKQKEKWWGGEHDTQVNSSNKHLKVPGQQVNDSL